MATTQEMMVGTFQLVCLIVLLTGAIVAHAFRPRTWSNFVVSYTINRLLLWWYPLRSADNQIDIPTCPYVFPDGGGSTAKFLKGESASRDWEARYGPIYRIWSGLTPEIVLTRPEDVKTAYRDSGQHKRAQNLNSGWLLGALMGDGVGFLSQGEWKKVHEVVSTPFAQKPITYVPLIQYRVQSALETLQKQYGMSDTKGQLSLRPASDLQMLPFLIISDILYGKLPAFLEEKLMSAVKLRTKIWESSFKGGLSLFRFGQLLQPTLRREVQQFHMQWAQFNDEAHQYALDTDRSLPIIGLYESVQQGHISRTNLLHSLDEALFANIDVTIGSFSWNPLFLAMNQNIQDELRREIQKKRQMAEEDPDIMLQYLSGSSTLLSSCVRESGRLKPIANYTYPQSMPTERIVGGYHVPAGSYVIVDSNALNVRNPSWGNDREQYRPQRFLEESVSASRYRLWRYGFGPRQCMAQHVADVILKVLLSYVIENFRVRLDSKEDDWSKRRPDQWFSVAEQDLVCEPVLG